MKNISFWQTFHVKWLSKPIIIVHFFGKNAKIKHIKDLVKVFTLPIKINVLILQ